MITLTLLYGTVIGGGFALAALLIERALRLSERQTRGVWIAAMAGTLGFTALLIQRVDRPMERVEVVDTPAGPATRTVRTTASGATESFTSRLDGARAEGWWRRAAATRTIGVRSAWPAALDASMGAGWLLASTAWLVILLSSARAIQRQRRGWARALVSDTPVYVSHDVGPAVFGVLRPSIVVPAWVTSLDDTPRALIVRHEREHVHGRDQAVLAAATVFVAVMPLNAALWWMYGRLRAAVEMDCDRRVLEHGVAPKEYGSLLVDMGERMLAGTVPVAALAESRSLTKRRLIAMLTQRTRFATIKSLALLALGVVVAAGATRAPQPVMQERAAPAPLEMSVWSNEARLLVPLPHHDAWEWNLPSTVGDLEYNVDVLVEGQTAHRYGFSYWKGGRTPKMSGDLLALMRAGQKTFWERASGDTVTTREGTQVKTAWKAVSGVPVTVEPIGDSLLITLHDAREVQRTYGARPATVTLTIQTPYEPEKRVTVPVVYR